ncbi:SSU ribosomal protein S30P /sigma 54 modulation protein [Geodermatophilus saharensis]|uniref:Ribosome hibernation promoting factor n=1 Tax=Geodermatophilus saharensis TaxID=1137994 RepID=A0A239A1T4_9ACTN|nr:ribosome-associated translation inhibitor RaiA [Geodermatophilus saharensis]SNR89058.1 SSU ribosomal protein S30P /sigma 54 modulation protein [Geodermatophilus saharensis]
MEIVVRGRNVEVPEHYRQHVEDKVGQLERFDGKLSRIDVELFHEKNPRQSANCQRVEITLRGKGPVVRAEASAPDFYAALDLSCAKLDNRLRRANDRRRVHHGRRTPPSVRVSAADAAPLQTPAVGVPDLDEQLGQQVDGEPLVTDLDEHLPGRIVREKHHPATPMTVDQALLEMELVGHDFYLFHCADTGRPTVVYRRHAFDYGLIRLVDPPIGEAGAAASATAQPAAAPPTSTEPTVVPR